MYLVTKNFPKASYCSSTLYMAYKAIPNMTPVYLGRLHNYHYFPSYILYYSNAFTLFTLLPLGLSTYSFFFGLNWLIFSHTSGPSISLEKTQIPQSFMYSHKSKKIC